MNPTFKSRAIRVALTFSATLLLLAPLLWMLPVSLHEPGQPLRAAGLAWPEAPTLAAYARVFEWVPMLSGLLNSLAYTVAGVAVSLVMASLTGFGIARLDARRMTLAVVALVIAASIPLTAIWVPRFVLFESLGLGRSGVPLLAPALYGASPLFVLLYTMAFRRLGPEPFEAASLEGVGALRQWWHFALPQVRPTTVAVATLAAMQFWGAFLEPLLYLEGERELTAPLLLHALDLLGPTQWTVLMAGSALLAAPVLLVFVAVQPLLNTLSRDTAK
ncbi:MAG: carbohydrate ABC transporter permease [Thiobacillus sp.]|nr:carbohydrate ABC transporter permease [Thiobacillus sp.]